MLKVAYEILKDDKDFSEYMTEKVCESCKGNRLCSDSLAVKVASKSIGDIINMSIENATKFLVIMIDLLT